MKDTNILVAGDDAQADGARRYYVPRAADHLPPDAWSDVEKSDYAWLDELKIDGPPFEVDLSKSGESVPSEAYKVMAGRLHQAFHTRRAKAKEAGLPEPKFKLKYFPELKELWVKRVKGEV